MPVQADSATFRISSAWAYRGVSDGVFQPGEQQGDLTHTLAIDAGDFPHKRFLAFILQPGDEQVIDLRSFEVDQVGDLVTGASVLTFELKAWAAESGGKVRVKPYAAGNPLGWPFDGADGLTLSVGPLLKCAVAWQDGAAATVSDAARNVSVSNPGTAAVSVAVAATVGV